MASQSCRLQSELMILVFDKRLVQPSKHKVILRIDVATELSSFGRCSYEWERQKVLPCGGATSGEEKGFAMSRAWQLMKSARNKVKKL